MSSRRNESGVLGGLWRSKHLIAARALSCRDWENPKSIQRARHMAHEGASLSEIAAALGWTVSLKKVSQRLRKYNIRPVNPSNKRHRGIETGFPASDRVNTVSFRPRILEGA